MGRGKKQRRFSGENFFKIMMKTFMHLKLSFYQHEKTFVVVVSVFKLIQSEKRESRWVYCRIILDGKYSENLYGGFSVAA